jgi:hypothetical protein
MATKRTDGFCKACGAELIMLEGDVNRIYHPSYSRAVMVPGSCEAVTDDPDVMNPGVPADQFTTDEPSDG